jgi:hypothetical protein
MTQPLACDLARLERGVTNTWKSFDLGTVNGNASA